MRRRGERDGPSAQALPTDRLGQPWCYSWSLLLSSSRGGSGVSRFGFRRLFEFPTLIAFPRRRSFSASSHMFIQEGCVAYSIVRPRGSDRISKLTQRQSRIGSQILLQATVGTIYAALAATVFVVSVSFHGSLRSSMTQQRTRSFRATATIAFFLRVFCPPVSRS